MLLEISCPDCHLETCGFCLFLSHAHAHTSQSISRSSSPFLHFLSTRKSVMQTPCFALRMCPLFVMPPLSSVSAESQTHATVVLSCRGSCSRPNMCVNLAAQCEMGASSCSFFSSLPVSSSLSGFFPSVLFQKSLYCVCACSYAHLCTYACVCVCARVRLTEAVKQS